MNFNMLHDMQVSVQLYIDRQRMEEVIDSPAPPRPRAFSERYVHATPRALITLL